MKRRWHKIALLLTGKMAQVDNETEKVFSLDRVEGTVKLSKTIELPPFSTIQVHGMIKVKGHNKKVNLIVEPMKNRPNPSAVVVPSYTVLKPGSRKVNMKIRNKRHQV